MAIINRGIDDDGTSSLFVAGGARVGIDLTVADQSIGPSSNLTVSNWYIDAVNGKDTNSGQASNAPLKTFAALKNKWGSFNKVAATGNNLAVVVTLLSNLPSSDPIDFEVKMDGSVSILIIGAATTTIASGTLTGAQSKVRASAIPQQVTDAAVAGGTWSQYQFNGATPGRFFNVTNNSVAWIAKDLGGQTARLSEPIVPFANVATNVPRFPVLSSAGTGNPGQRPSAAMQTGDSYVIQGLTQCFVGNITAFGNPSTGHGLGGNVPCNVAFQDLQINRINGGNFIQFNGLGGTNLHFYGCLIGEGILVNSGGDVWEHYSVQRRSIGSSGGFIHLRAGLVVCPVTLATMGYILDFDTMYQGLPGGGNNNGLSIIAGVTCKIGTACVFDVATPGPNNSDGAACHVGPGGSILLITFQDSTHALWGSGSVGPGVSVAPGGTFAYQTNAPTVSGSTPGTNDFALGGALTARAWDETANAGAGGYTTLITGSWANLAKSIGTGGFGGNAVNVGVNAILAHGT